MAGYPKNKVTAVLGLEPGLQKVDTPKIVKMPLAISIALVSEPSFGVLSIVQTPSKIPPAIGSRRVRVLVQTNGPGALTIQQIARAPTLAATIVRAAAASRRCRLPRTYRGHNK